jgi:NADH-quinone oxidoreductase subunit L
MNRVGDIGYLIGIALLYTSVSSLDFSVLYVLISVAPETLSFAVIPHTVDTICGFLLVGVIAKSAQIGLHTWLPAAMEGPTPVSALIHAATMVTAGIFLVIRTSFLFELSP